MNIRSDSSIDWAFVYRVFDRLPPLQDSEYRESFIRSIARMQEDGWSLDDVVKFLRCSEHFNPHIDEDVALRRMREIKEKYDG